MVEGYHGQVWPGHFGQQYSSYVNCYDHGKWIICDLSEVWATVYAKYNDDYSQQHITTSSMAVTPDGMLFMDTNKGIVKITIDSLSN